MPKDKVLRTCVVATIGGEQAVRFIDTVERGDFYLLVLRWAFIPGEEGEFPARTISVEKRHFQVSHDPTSEFELLLSQPMNFDQFVWSDVEVSEDVIWSEPDNLFHPRPKDDD